MSDEILAAIIAGSATVVVAFISGFFVLLDKKRKKDKPSRMPNIKAGGHAITATDNATQNVYISEERNPKSGNNQKYVKIIEIADKLTIRANNILVENEEVLYPIFQDKPSRHEIRESMERLLNIQKSRADFGEWKAYIANKQDLEKDPGVKVVFKEFVDLIDNLQDTLYSFEESSFSRQDEQRNALEITKKYLVSRYLTVEEDNKHRIITLIELRKVASNYLEYLRDLTQKIGEATGKLKAFADN